MHDIIFVNILVLNRIIKTDSFIFKVIMMLTKTVIALLLGCLIVFTNSCNDNEVNKESDMESMLKLYTWVLDEQLEGTGYWVYDDKPPEYGYWVSDDEARQVNADSVFVYEQLDINNPRIMAPLGYDGRPNLNIYIEFDGAIEVETEDPTDRSLRLAHSLEEPSEPKVGNWIVENGFRARGPFMLNVCPIGKLTTAEQVVTRDTLTDREYYVHIKAYAEDGRLLITAALKFVVLEDDAYPYERFSSGTFSPNEERSRFLSIELVSYEYSDIYKFDEKSVVIK